MATLLNARKCRRKYLFLSKMYQQSLSLFQFMIYCCNKSVSEIQRYAFLFVLYYQVFIFNCPLVSKKEAWLLHGFDT